MSATEAIDLPSGSFRRLPLASALAGVIVSVLFLWLAGRNVEWSRLWDHLQHVRVVPLMIGVAAALAAFVVMAYRWHVLLDGTAQVSVADTFDFIAIGFLAGLVMPQRLGDVVKVVVLARRAGASRTSVLGTVVLERLSDVIMLLALAATFAITVKVPILLTASTAVLAVATVSALIVLRFRLSCTSRFLSTARRYLPSASIGALEAQASKLADGLHAIRSGSHFLTALALAALVWGLSGLSMSEYIAAFGLAVPWYAGYLVILLTNLGGILPSSPGSIGVYHYMTVLALSTWSQDRTAALTFAFVTHALAMLLIVSTGLWGLARQGLSWRAVGHGVTQESPLPEARAARSAMASPAVRATVALVGLAALVAANYFLRHTLERGDTYINSYLPYAYPAVEKRLFAPSYPWPKLFLPIPELGGAWTTTSLIVTHFIELRLTPPVTWYVFNAALMVMSFVTSWAVFRSLAFSFTFVICMGFGTQLYHTYAVTGSMSLCLLFIYYELVLLSALRVVQGAAPTVLWRTTFVLSVLVTALAYEAWLDFAVFMWLAAALTVVVGYRFGKREWWPGLLFASGWLAVVCVAYLYIKMNFGYGQNVGTESDVVFNYPTLAPKIEDVLSNVLTQFYMVVTNFLPPLFLSSTTFYELGGDRIVELQHGYHAQFSYLVVMQYLFLWRYYAGASFVVFGYAAIRTVRRSVRAWSPENFAAAIFLLMAATGGPTHAFVKARPMNSMPVLGYHVIVGVLGVALLLSLFAKGAMARPWRRGVGAMVVVAMWVTIFWGALTRPALLSHEAAQAGLGNQIYPNPWVTLTALFGHSSPQPGGASGYRLTKYVASPVEMTPLVAPVAFGGTLEPLPNSVSDLQKWTTGIGVTVTPVDRGYHVVGNATGGGYQLSSPFISVPANHRLLVRVRGTMKKGWACLGILNPSQRWILPPAADRGDLSVDTGNNGAVMFVFINCGPASGAQDAVVFEVESVSYGILLNAAR